VADQHDLAQVLAPHEVQHIGDVDFEVGIAAGQMGALTHARQAHRVDIMTGGTQ
jgi:hypothetical protein